MFRKSKKSALKHRVMAAASCFVETSGLCPQTDVGRRGDVANSATNATQIPHLAAAGRYRCDQDVGAPDTIRTCGLHLRRVALYPAELRAHRYSDSVRDRPRSIANSRIDMAQTTRAKASPIIAIRTPQPPFGLLPWCFRDLECDFRASFEFRQSLGLTHFSRHSPLRA